MSQPNPTNVEKKQNTTNDHGWPANGELDLTAHDLPHHSSTAEWWYQNCHLATIKGRHFSLFASFCRKITGTNPASGEFIYTYTVNWALTDTASQKYYAGEVQQPATVSNDKLHLVIEHNGFQKIQEGIYQLTLNNPVNGFSCKLIFMPFVNPVRHGNNGIVAGAGSDNLFYYFIPACEVNGVITINGEEAHEVEGCGWYDHAFGEPHTANTGPEVKPYNPSNWLSLQLDNNWQISVYEFFNNNDKKQSAGRWAILIDADGNQISVTDFQLTPESIWTSPHTGKTYATKWKLVVAEKEIDIDIHATQPDQEFNASTSFWAGRMQARGKFGEKMVYGLGYVEVS